MFPSKPDTRTYKQTVIRTDISTYTVASLLKKIDKQILHLKCLFFDEPIQILCNIFQINLSSGVVYLAFFMYFFYILGRRKKSSKSNLLDEIETEKIESADKASSEEEILIKTFYVRDIVAL